MNSTRRSLALMLVLLVAPACRPPAERALLPLPPPDDWAESLAADRSARDDDFLTPSSPLLEEDRPTFDGLDYFAPDPAWYFVGEIEAVPPQPLEMTFTDGTREQVTRVGRIRFPVDGELHELFVYRMSGTATGAESLLLPFNDATTGTETYPAGRYLNIAGAQGGPFVFDFNRAYNPLCAYGGPYGCPVTPPENRLDVRVTAGERGYRRDG